MRSNLMGGIKDRGLFPFLKKFSEIFQIMIAQPGIFSFIVILSIMYYLKVVFFTEIGRFPPVCKNAEVV